MSVFTAAKRFSNLLLISAPASPSSPLAAVSSLLSKDNIFLAKVHCTGHNSSIRKKWLDRTRKVLALASAFFVGTGSLNHIHPTNLLSSSNCKTPFLRLDLEQERTLLVTSLKYHVCSRDNAFYCSRQSIKLNLITIEATGCCLMSLTPWNTKCRKFSCSVWQTILHWKVV